VTDRLRRLVCLGGGDLEYLSSLRPGRGGVTERLYLRETRAGVKERLSLRVLRTGDGDLEE